MAADWWTALPPEAQAFLAALGTDLLKGWAKDLANGLLKAIGRRAARPFRTEPRQEAMEEALAEALGRALATLPLQPDLAEHYQTLFDDFLHRPKAQRELSLVLAPRPTATLDLALLRREFEAAGYDAGRLPGLDFDRFVATLVGAFYDAAAQRAEFQGALEIGLLRGLAEQLHGLTGLAGRTARAAETTAEHTAALPEIRDILRERMEGPTVPQRPPGPVRTRVPEPRAVRLIGRTAERDWLCGRLKAGDVAAVAGVRGIGGIGKTELAIAVTRQLENHFEGGVIWIDCGPNDAFAIQERMAAAIGAELAGEDLARRADALAAAFSHQPATLVVLDDIRRRHLADWRCIAPPRPPCALLVTSRRSDLPLPPQAIRRIDVLEPEQSRALLATLLPEAWLEREPQAVAEIAALLEHVPLALTLAARRAARIAARKDEATRQPLATLLTELRARRARVLDQGERPDLSVLITFDASYDDLEPADQIRLCRLGVFARNEFELFALQAVWQDEEDAARQALLRLVDAGLVEEVEEETWWAHDLLREYAAERLARAGTEEMDAVLLAHAACWQHYLENMEPRSVADWRDLDAHRAEIEQAAEWLLGDWQTDPAMTAGLAVAISEAFQPYVLPRWEAWLEAGLAAAEAAGKRNAARRLQRGLSAHCLHCGQAARARELLHASLSTARELLEAAATEEETEIGQRGVAVTLGDIARLKAQGGDVAGALALHQERLDIFEQLGDVRSRAVTLGDIARLKAQGGDVAGALALHQEMLDIFEQLGDVRSRAVTLYDRAGLYGVRRDSAAAERLYRDSMEISRRIGDVEGTFAVLVQLGQLALAQGRRDEAVALLQEARQGFAQLGFAPWLAHVDELLAQAQGQMLTLDDLATMVRAALRGDHQAGQQAWETCEGLTEAGDATLATLGRGLRDVLSGIPPETALAGLPDDLRAQVLEALDG